MSVQDTIAAKQKAMIPTRLVRGAEILGQLWREKVRCRSEWSGICPCDSPNDFCVAKKRFLGLVRELCNGRYPYNLSGNEGFLVLECMTLPMFRASGLTIVKTVPGDRGLMRIGRDGVDCQTILDLDEIYREEPGDFPIAVDSVIMLQEVFGGR